MYTDKQRLLRDSLLKEAITMTSGSVAPSTRKAYNSIWKKWTVFMQTCHHNPTEDHINCKGINQQQLLQLLLMFVAYCVNVLKTAPTSIPGILSGLRNNLVLRFVPLDAFDDSLLVALKAAVKRLPYSPRVRLPCTYSMVLYIIQQNTQHHGTKHHFMLAVGVSMAYYLCLRASEYVSKSTIPDPESHQFDSKSVEFQCFNTTTLIPSSGMRSICWTSIEIVRFTIQHAKNVRRGYGIPIWFSTNEDNPDAIAFLQLIYLWARMSTRLPDDPFLSYRSDMGILHCLVYANVHNAIAQCAIVFGFDPQWFKPHSLRMAAPTVLRAAGGDDGDILNLGRWRQVPTSLIYQGTSTTNNNRVLCAVSSPTLFTPTDIHLTRLLPAVKGQNKLPTVRRF